MVSIRTRSGGTRKQGDTSSWHSSRSSSSSSSSSGGTKHISLAEAAAHSHDASIVGIQHVTPDTNKSSKGVKKTISLKEASSGHVAKTTPSRNVLGQAVKSTPISLKTASQRTLTSTLSLPSLKEQQAAAKRLGISNDLAIYLTSYDVSAINNNRSMTVKSDKVKKIYENKLKEMQKKGITPRVTATQQASIIRANERETELKKYLTENPLADSAGNEIKRFDIKKFGGSHAQGIYSGNWYLSRGAQRKNDEIDKFASMQLTENTNAITKKKILDARELILSQLSTTDKNNNIRYYKALDRGEVKQASTLTPTEQSIQSIKKADLQTKKDKFLKAQQAFLTTPTNANREKSTSAFKELENAGKEYNAAYKEQSDFKTLYEAGKKLALGEPLTTKEGNVINKYSTEDKLSPGAFVNYTSGGLIKTTRVLEKWTKKGEVLGVVGNVPIAGSVTRAGYGVVTGIPEFIGEAEKGFSRFFNAPKIIGPSIPIGLGEVAGSIKKDPVEALASIIITHKVGAGLKKINPVSIKKSGLQEITPGEQALVKDVSVGYTLSLKNKPLVTVKNGKISYGVKAVPKELIAGKQVQAFGEVDTKVFEKTLKQFGEVEQEYFKSGKTIAKTVYKQRKPITKPKTLDILSEHIPQNMKPVVKNTIVKYGGLLKTKDIQVYGSVPQKMQMPGFFTRSPKDIEISVSNVNAFVSNFRKNALKSGFKEGTHFRVTGNADAPKIEFKQSGKWVKGVEVFTHKKPSAKTIKAEGGKGYRSESEIAFGFKGKKSIKVEKVKVMKLQEQAARKFAGGTTLKDGKIELVHGGRVKDVRDLIEIGTAYEVTGKLGISKEIISYTGIAVKKNPTILESPIVKYIYENGKLPTKPQILKMVAEHPEKLSSELGAAATAPEINLIFSSKKVSVRESISKVARSVEGIKPVPLSSMSQAVFSQAVKTKFSRVSAPVTKSVGTSKAATSRVTPSKAATSSGATAYERRTRGITWASGEEKKKKEEKEAVIIANELTRTINNRLGDIKSILGS